MRRLTLYSYLRLPYCMCQNKVILELVPHRYCFPVAGGCLTLVITFGIWLLYYGCHIEGVYNIRTKLLSETLPANTNLLSGTPSGQKQVVVELVIGRHP